MQRMTAIDCIKEGEVFYKQKKFHEAEVSYTNAINRDPMSTKAYLKRGNLFFGQHKYSEALNDYDAAITIDPNYSFAYFNRGLIFYNQGKYAAAFESMTKCIELSPNVASDYYHRGNVLFKQKKYTEAIADYDRAIQLNPKFINAYQTRGNAYHNQLAYFSAIGDYNKVIELDPNYSPAYYQIGLISHVQSHYSSALYHYDRYIELCPDSAEAYLQRAIVYEAVKNSKDPVPRGIKLFSDFKSLEETLDFLAFEDYVCAIELSDDEEANEKLNSLIEKKTNSQIFAFIKECKPLRQIRLVHDCFDTQSLLGKKIYKNAGYLPQLKLDNKKGIYKTLHQHLTNQIKSWAEWSFITGPELVRHQVLNAELFSYITALLVKAVLQIDLSVFNERCQPSINKHLFTLFQPKNNVAKPEKNNLCRDFISRKMKKR